MRNAALAWLLLTSTAGAQCPEVTGLFTGTAETSDGTKVEVMLNLACEEGHGVALFFTSVGDFPGTDVQGEGSHVIMNFDTRAALGSFDLTLKGDTLSGTLELAGTKGTASFSRAGPAQLVGAMTPRLDLTPEQWRADIATFAQELPKHHANAFFSLKREEFDAEIAALDARAATANGDEMFVGLQQIAKSIGDGHTGVVAPPDRRAMPLTLAKFGGEFRVTAVGPGLEKALGARVIRIGRMLVQKVWIRALTLAPRDERDEIRRQDALAYMARGYALHGLDIIPERDHAVYTLVNDAGESFDLDVKGLAPDEKVEMTSIIPRTALSAQEPGAPFWCKALEHATVYCNWRAYQDLAKHAKEMFAAVDKAKAQKLILDMRDNGGGDNTVGDAQLVKPLKARADLNRKGRLYVLIGAETFSAAMNNAAQFQDETNAILVGETIGEKPNSYQEPRQFRLPNSHLVVRYSTLWYAFRKAGPNVVAPEKEILPTWEEVRAGRDPALDWALAQP